MYKLKLSFLAFFCAVFIPCTYLLVRSYNHLESEALLSSKEKAHFIAQLINQRIKLDASKENIRSFSEYRFIMAVSVIGGEEVTLSPLAQIDQKKTKGLIGYFQIDPDLSIHTPTLPEGALADLELKDRYARLLQKIAIEKALRGVNLANLGVVERVNTRTVEATMLQGNPQIKDPQLEKFLQQKKMTTARYESLTEKRSIAFHAEAQTDSSATQETIVDTYQEVAVHSFQAILHLENLIYYRIVLQGGKRYIQGFILKTKEYLQNILDEEVGLSSYNLINGIRLTRTLKREGYVPIIEFGNAYYDAQNILKTPLASPLNNLNLHFLKNSGGSPPGSTVIWALGILLFLLLGGGLISIYKIIVNNIEMSQGRSDFISAVSHELKTPLTAIRMYSEMLEEGFILDPAKQHQYYRKISSESNRLSRLIQNVLDLSKVERNQWVGNMATYQLDELVNEYYRTYSKSFENRNFEIDLLLDSRDSSHNLDRDAFLQILVNIVENAIKFSSTATKKRVEIKTSFREDKTILSIRDFGPGVPSSDLQNIFNSFYRVEKEMVRKTTGTGIGLSLVEKLCQEMNIKVEARNTNPGLSIIMHIPIEMI